MIYGQPVTFGGKPDLQEKTVTPTTSKQTVTPDTDYDGLSKVTVNAIPSTYVKPSATKEATTYTPTTSNQTIAAGTYCSGKQTIQGDSDLKAANIAKGVNIFGVTGTFVCPPTLLWTNASPTSEFVAQTISLPTGYSAYIVEYARSSSTNYNSQRGKAYLGFSTSKQANGAGVGYLSSNYYAAGRVINSCSDGSINFGLGIQFGQASEVKTYGIPIRIWGVKWTL